MKIGILMSIFFLIIGCSSNELDDNEHMKNSIDKMEFSKKIIEVEIDLIGNILDTLSIESLKFDSKGKKRFKKKEYWNNERKFSSTDYFKPDEDLFFRETFDEEGKSYSIFETLLNKKGEIEKAIQISKEKETIDTIFMNYLYDYYQNGNVKKLIIKAIDEEIGELVSTIKYDEEENQIFQLVLMKDDTISFQHWEYSNTILQRSIYTSYQSDTSKSVYYFGEKKLLTREDEFAYNEGFFIKSKEINHIYDKSNNRIKTIEKKLKTNEKKYIKYMVEK